MKTLYIECKMGAAGDMLTAALLELVEDRARFLNQMNTLGIGSLHVDAFPAAQCGIIGTRMKVAIAGVEESVEDIDLTYDHIHSHEHENEHIHEHAHMHSQEKSESHHEHTHGSTGSIQQMIRQLEVSNSVKTHAMAIYDLIAEAEAHVHGTSVSDIHFHEVGEKDAVADIVGVCLLMEQLAPEKVIVSPIHVGNGSVRCSHGILPVPTPATAHILQGVPIYSGAIHAELCTPTGAAILKHFADSFGSMPVMSVSKIGCGMGKKEFEVANCVRVFLGETTDREHKDGSNGTVAVLSCNLDDMTGEAIGYASRLLMKEGARDVFTNAVQMKKDRPGILLTCVCDESKADVFVALILKHTSTFGVRKMICSRYMLDRTIREIETSYGTVRIKEGSGYGVSKWKVEYDDVATLAKEHDVPINEIFHSVAQHIETSKEEL